MLFIAGHDGLWKSDGTADGTVLVKAVADPFSLTTMTDTLFFLSDDKGGELWTSDGTTEGTVLVADFCYLGTCSTYLGGLTNVNGMLFFQSGIGSHWALWKSDGTFAGTVMLKHFSDLYTPSLTNLNGVLFFNGDFTELWRSDGSATGTVLVTSVPTSVGMPYIGRIISANGRLFFTAGNLFSATAPISLWTSDGTSEGTALLRDFGDGDLLLSLTEVHGTVFFVRMVGQGLMMRGCELWKSDGTVAGTVMVKDLTLASLELFPDFFQLTPVHGALLFTANDGIHGAEPWVSDGTSAGTRMLQDIAPGAPGSHPNGYTVAGSSVFFSANDGSTGQELWAVPLESVRPSWVYLPTIMK
jgi:ELWxxDGT repeat protein